MFQRDGKPYCNRCYGAMFGPRGYGHGGVESHTFHQGQTGQVSANPGLINRVFGNAPFD